MLEIVNEKRSEKVDFGALVINNHTMPGHETTFKRFGVEN